MEMKAGRSFSRAVSADTSRAILVNEALVEEYGWDDPIGRHLPGPFPDPNLILEGASSVLFSSSLTPEIAVRIRGDDLPATMDRIERTWQRVAPAQPFAYTFLDEAVDSQYRQEERISRIVGIASALSIFIACLGLFGLAALTALRRTKEIGIRKVLGASVPSIVRLLSKDFLKLVAVAFVIAVPVAYYAMSTWLEDFAYRIDLGVGVFLLAGLLALVIALATVGYQAIKAALADPVDVLRNE